MTVFVTSSQYRQTNSAQALKETNMFTRLRVRGRGRGRGRGTGRVRVRARVRVRVRVRRSLRV